MFTGQFFFFLFSLLAIVGAFTLLSLRAEAKRRLEEES